jgi:hypothetical protein
VTAPAGFDPRPFVVSGPWRFAKTMADIPHEYVVEGKVDDSAGFTAMVQYIADHGYRARWRHLPPNRYLELDGWRYWVMRGRGDSSILIINRERLPGQPLRRVE